MTIWKTGLRRLALLMAVLAAVTAMALAADATADSPQALYDAMERGLRAQEQTFSVAYTGDAAADGLLLASGEPSLGLLLRQTGASSPDGPDNADYPTLNVRDGTAVYDSGVFTFTFTYLATQKELDEVSRRAKEIVASFDLREETALTKTKLLYEYICTHYIYDETLTKFSAYDGLTTGSMVCQGYALLTYRVLWEAGLPCRVITGISGGENHAWNIVELDGKWYNLDATWDAASEIGGHATWRYFLKSPAEFMGHTRFAPYTTAAFDRAHPMSQTSRQLPQITLSVGGGAVGAMILRSGVEVQLTANLPEGVLASELQWVSESPTLVTVTADGRVLANGPGATWITAKIDGNRGIISAELPVQAVDLRPVSGWAFEPVTAFYLQQLLPVSLCEAFQQGITRAELARLLNQFVVKTKDFPSFTIDNTFLDLDETADVLAILNCKAIGLLDGTSATRFGPNDLVSREQAAKALVRLLEYLESSTYEGRGTLSVYADAAAVSDWAAPFVAAATEEGLLQGAYGSFRPDQPMTREQMIVALERVYLRWSKTRF